MSFPEFHGSWPAALLALSLLGGVALLLRRSGRRAFLALRLGVYLLLLWMALEPTAAVAPRTSRKPALAVLLDVSRSMGIRDPEERLAAAQRILKKSDPFLRENFNVSYYQFSGDSARASLPGLLKAKPFGNRTRLFESVEQALREDRQERPAVLLFSDGAHADSGEPRTAEWSAEAPLYAVGLGNAENLSDIAVKEVRGSDFAFKNRPLQVTARIRNFGYAGRSVPVVLSEKRGAALVPIETERAVFREPSGETEVQFRFVPPAVGHWEYRVEVPVQPGEAARGNNFKDFQIEVNREKIRVLYLCGQPSPEYAFLRQLLKSDPSIDLVSFVILRNPENVIPVPDEQLSLIPFPVDDIFVRTLPEFDLLIFENFTYSRFGITPAHLEDVRRFVEDKGGGFLMIGGESSFGLGGYPATALERILPVKMDPSTESIAAEPAGLKVLEPQHPLMSLGESLPESARVWKSLPALSGYHLLPGVKSGATLLASLQGRGAPALVCWQRGKGRVLAMATLSTWQWALGESSRGLLQSGYQRFWRQAVRWLTSASDAKPLRIVLTEPEIAAGRKTTVKLIVHSERLKSPRAAEVSLTAAARGRAAQSLPLTAAGPSEYWAEWTPDAEGEYQLAAAVKDGGRALEERRTVSVQDPDEELENPYPDHAWLREIARRSGGEYFDARDFTPELLKGKIKGSPGLPRESVQRALWTNPWIFSLAVLALLAEWGIRRYRGEA